MHMYVGKNLPLSVYENTTWARDDSLVTFGGHLQFKAMGHNHLVAHCNGHGLNPSDVVGSGTKAATYIHVYNFCVARLLRTYWND